LKGRSGDGAPAERRDYQKARLLKGAAAKRRKGASRLLLDMAGIFPSRRLGKGLALDVARSTAEGACAAWHVRRSAAALSGSRAVRRVRSTRLRSSSSFL